MRSASRPLRIALLCLVVIAAGCVAVKPYQRRRLSKGDMAEEGEGGLLAGQEHATDYREGAAGGFGGGGGGCGCN